MKKELTKVEWVVVEDEEAWLVSQRIPPIENPVRVESATKPVHRKEQVIAMLVVGLVLLLMGGWLWQQQLLAAEMPGELQAALMQDLPTQPSSADGPQSTPRNTTFHSSSAADAVVLGAHLDGYQQLGDRVMLHVTVEYPVEGKMMAYRETRFLEKKGKEWQRIAPDPGLMGPKQILTIAHFTILYQAVDADAVYEVAPKLVKLYAKLRQDFGLPVVVDGSSTYTIEVAASGAQAPYVIDFRNHEMLVPSPVLLSVPVEMTAATVLYQAIVYPLARLAVYDSMEQHRGPWHNDRGHLWPSVSRLLALWQLWEEGGPLATGREEVVRWLYANRLYANNSGNEKQQSLPNGYEHLCRTYRIWGMSPADVSIPLTCTVMDRQTQAAQHFPIRPKPVREQLYPKQWAGTLVDAFDNVMLETVIAYIVVTYGRQQLPVFVTALDEHTSLYTLIPAVFGLSSVEFEAGWQAYLAQRYQ